MEIRASRLLKIVYCLTLVGTIFPAGVAASRSWIGLVFGGGPFFLWPHLPLFLLILFGLRIITVVLNPVALDVYAPGIVSKALRIFSIFLIFVGLASMIGMFFIKPITLAIFRNAGDGGIAYFAVGLYLVIFSASGIIGVILFEFVRIMNSFSRKRIPGAAPATDTPSQKGNIKRKASQLITAILTLVVFIMLGNFLYWLSHSFLLSAISSHNTERAKTIINLGIGVNYMDSTGATTLHHAVSWHNIELVELLIKKGADVNAEAGYGYSGTPLWRVAADEGHIEDRLKIAKLLIEGGANVNKNSRLGPALHWAAQGNNLEIAKFLIEKGADVNMRNNWGRSPLGWAIFRGHGEMIELLTARGAKLSPDESAQLMEDAVKYGSLKSIEILISFGVDVTPICKKGVETLKFENIKDFLRSHCNRLTSGK